MSVSRQEFDDLKKVLINYITTEFSRITNNVSLTFIFFKQINFTTPFIFSSFH